MLFLTVYLFPNVECFFIQTMKFQRLCSGKAEIPKEIFFAVFFISRE